VIHRPLDMNQFEFVIVSGLRTAQLMRGCTPRVVKSLKPITTAQREVAEGKVVVTWKAPALPRARPALADLVRLQEPANGANGSTRALQTPGSRADSAASRSR
jgi:DNA-directed RNA polymerase subunit K/omega